jgi:spoIIIJ-associated protein
MKDRVFVGADVDEARAVAAASLGLPLASLRFVVLEVGTPGGRGLKPTPARIAVMVEEPHSEGHGERRDRPAAHSYQPPAEEAEQAPEDAIRDTLRRVAQAGGLEFVADVGSDRDSVRVELSGPDALFFLEPDDKGEVLRATEHLLLRLYGRALEPRTLRLDGVGFRERRDAALAAEARRHAEAVRNDGQPRTMPPLNSYERRIVHIALRDEPGVSTASTGEGAARRLVIAPATGEPGSGPQGDPAAE